MNKLKLTFLGIKNTFELIGKILKVSWNDDENLKYDHYFLITSFSTDSSGRIEFQPVITGQGGDLMQVSIFGDGEFHIQLLDNYKKTISGTPVDKGYFYSTKKFKSHSMSKGTLSILQ